MRGTLHARGTKLAHTHRMPPHAKATHTEAPPQAPADEEDADIPSPKSETGWSPTSPTTVSKADRDIAKMWSRPPPAGADEVEHRPLPGLQKVVQTGKPLTASNSHIVPPDSGMEGLCAEVNPQSNTVAVGCRNSKVMLLDLADLRLQTVHDLSDYQIAAITALRYRPDGYGGTSNVAYMAQESNILTVHVSRGHVMNKRQERGNSINALSVRPGANPMLASAGSDKVVRVYDETTGKLFETLDHGDDIETTGHSNIVYAVNWKPDDPNILVSGGWDGTVNMWDLRLARAVRSFAGPHICGGDNLDIRENELLTGSWRHNNPLQLWDMRSGKLLTNCPFYQPEPEACMLYAAKFTPGPTDLIIAGGSGKRPCAKAFHTNGAVLGTLPVPTGITAIASSPTWTEKQRSVVMCCMDRILLLKI